MADERRTALGSAHERFLRSLPDRGRELRDLVRQLQALPTDERLAEQAGRRLHALYASAQVFQEAPLLDAIKSALGGMETARLERRPPTPGEIDASFALCDWLCGELSSPPPPRSSPMPAPGLGRRMERWSTTLAEAGAVAAQAQPEAEAEAEVAIARTVAGSQPAPDVIAVLAVVGPQVEREVRAALPAESCELTTSAEAETALSVIDQVSPDLVLVESGLLGPNAAELIQRLRGERAAGVRAVIVIVPELATDVEALLGRTHADDVLRLPLPSSGLFERLQRWAGRGPKPTAGAPVLRSGTVEEIASGVAEEIRRGIAGSLRQGRNERIEIGDQSELLAVAWSAVARIRAHLAERAAGRVRFDEALYEGGPTALALTDREQVAPYVGLSDALHGRRILLADDDPAVLWFFSSLLREMGAIAIEARDGREALELARRKPPDVVVSDILMPEIDGFTLCRELRRDLTLSHVPVILLSWKEDFLQRMRELDSGAVGYLRKEAGSHQILATVAEALRPRTELGALLAAPGEVQGRVEPIGVPTLLQTVASRRPNARIALRDAWNLFEVDIRSGSSLAVTRTASDGSFARGQAALRQLLGVDSGRFTVTAAGQGPARNPFAEPLDKLIADNLAHLGAVLDAVSDHRLLRVCRVVLDDDILSSLLTATPTGIADLSAHLREGESARDLVLSGAVAARDLEQHLRELARRGAIMGVFGANAEDLVQDARRRREQEPGALLHSSDRPRQRSAPPTELGEGDVEWIEPTRTEPAPPPPAAARAAPAAEPARAEPPAAADAAKQQAADPQEVSAQADGATGSWEDGPAASPSEPFSVRSGRFRARPRPGGPEHDRDPRLPIVFVLAALIVIGYAGFRLLHDRDPRPAALAPVAEHIAGAKLDAPSPPSATSSAQAPAAAQAGAAAAAGKPGSSGGLDSVPGFGRVLPYIDRSRGVSVGVDEGLLIVETDSKTAAPRVRVGGRDLGQAPIAAALPAGRHEVMLKRGAQTSFRYVVIRAGETRIVQIRE